MGPGGVDTNLVGVLPVCQFLAKTGRMALEALFHPLRTAQTWTRFVTLDPSLGSSVLH
jgi:hypothetical protein